MNTAFPEVTHHNHDVLHAVVMEIFHNLRQMRIRRLVVGEIQFTVHVIQIIPLYLLQHASLKF